ncbi:hypothetical protein MNB_SV-13-1511 [hydrothermal vent metagenome]|uniref:Uncharacterized protein n=1 Tax=hydrothermal vent metagenome TaxID=652676 RepID=A0A1W1CZ33_9ZZZZ
MQNNGLTPEENRRPYKVITYTDDVAFKYTLKNEEKSIEEELTFVWEDTLESFFEEYGEDKPFKMYAFNRENEQKILIDRIEGTTDDVIEAVQEQIAGKMKFGFDFSGQLHNDD